MYFVSPDHLKNSWQNPPFCTLWHISQRSEKAQWHALNITVSKNVFESEMRIFLWLEENMLFHQEVWKTFLKVCKYFCKNKKDLGPSLSMFDILLTIAFDNSQFWIRCCLSQMSYEQSLSAIIDLIFCCWHKQWIKSLYVCFIALQV